MASNLEAYDTKHHYGDQYLLIAAVGAYVDNQLVLFQEHLPKRKDDS